MILKKNILFLLFFISCFAAIAQEKFTISGTITDASSNETLIAVNIYFPDLKIGAVTNEYGFYSLTLPKGTHEINISYVGFATITEKITLTQNVKKNYSMNNSGQELNEVVISSAKTTADIRKPEMSVNKLSISAIKKMPVVMGEVDVIKSILFLPGVTNAGEGQSGFNVRGGGADQNLILLDEAMIFNSSHVFGFFSVFNPDAIKDLKLYKGGIPSKYGGRASSVLDIYQKDGNSNDFHVNGGIGLITSRLLAEGPIVKGKGSFLVGGRISYAHLFLQASGNDNSAYFYDLNTKLKYNLNPNNNLYLSGYFGRDIFSLNEAFSNTYGNATVNLRWNHIFNNNIFSNLSMIYSDYYYGLSLDFVGFNWDSGIKNYNLKYDFKHYLSNNIKLNYGFNSIYYDFNPGTIDPNGPDSSINYKQLEKKYAFENGIYLEVEQILTDKIAVNYGVRYSLFNRLGGSTVNQYENNQPVAYDSELKIYEKAKPTGSVSYKQNQTIANFDNLEPRLSVAYELKNNQSVKASYNRMVQYLQLVSNTTSPTPLDIWTPSDQYIKPQIADQVAVGYFNNFKKDQYTLELEGFYKEIQNRMDYIDGADLIANEAIEQVVLNGEMRSYGLEVLLRKNTGKFSGWIAYTISKSQQRTPGRAADEIGINNGEWYRSAYDKLHNLAITASYNLSPKWNFGGNFTFQSGQPVTYPNGQYVYQGITIPSYGERNKNSLPVYHHLDISATYTPKPDKNKGWQGEWVFSIYNVYNQKNAASISFQENTDTGANEAVKLSIFGIVPSISYNFKF